MSVELLRRDGTGPLVAAHRGGNVEAPENTLAAFEVAHRAGADIVELDAHRTADGCYVVMHDVTATRTVGVDIELDCATVAEVKSWDAGRIFGPAFIGHAVPTLAEALSWSQDKAALLIDVRCFAGEFYDVGADSEDLVQMVRAAGVQDRVVFQCSNHLLARAIHELDGRLPICATVRDRVLEPGAVCRSVGATMIFVDHAYADAGLVRDLHAEGIAVMTSIEKRLPGTIESFEDRAASAARLAGIGVDVLVTDDPRRFAHLVHGLPKPPAEERADDASSS
jgi:glycerophosphoryl diester phosphodiesterase